MNSLSKIDDIPNNILLNWFVFSKKLLLIRRLRMSLPLPGNFSADAGNKHYYWWFINIDY